MDHEIKCTKCQKMTSSLLDYRCPHCGNPIGITVKTNFDPQELNKGVHGHWRYANFFPYIKKADIVTLGEGGTPLVKLSGSAYVKLENLNPTGSFKDRGSTTLVTALREAVKDQHGFVAEDSSGNAGASMAAYCARASLKAEIYVPAHVAGPKYKQTLFYDAKVVKVYGTRSKVASEAQKPAKGKHYVGHILHPIFRDGIRTLSYEISEQLNLKPPDRVYIPVSAGTLLLGVIRGFTHLTESGVIKKMPTIVACQTQQVSPLYHQVKQTAYQPPEKVTSIADALVSVNPPLLNLMVEQLTEVNGDAEIVNEKETLEAFYALAKQGFLVEPSSAVAYAAYKKQRNSNISALQEKAVIILTGSGLKTTLEPR